MNFCVTIGGSTYFPDTALLANFFCGVYDSLKIMEEVVELVLKVGKRGADLYTALQTA